MRVKIYLKFKCKINKPLLCKYNKIMSKPKWISLAKTNKHKTEKYSYNLLLTWKNAPAKINVSMSK